MLDQLFSIELLHHAQLRELDGRSKLAAAAKGWVFVQLYAVYEFSLFGAVREAISQVHLHGIPFRQLRASLVGLMLDPEVTSLMECGRPRHWTNRLALFEKSRCNDPAATAEHTFPLDGSHMRVTQIQTIWAVFGLATPFVPRPQLTPLPNELVENRNAISHGRNRPEEVGRRYTLGEISKKISDTRDVCLHVIDSLDSHCSNSLNLQ